MNRELWKIDRLHAQYSVPLLIKAEGPHEEEAVICKVYSHQGSAAQKSKRAQARAMLFMASPKLADLVVGLAEALKTKTLSEAEELLVTEAQRLRAKIGDLQDVWEFETTKKQGKQ